MMKITLIVVYYNENGKILGQKTLKLDSEREFCKVIQDISDENKEFHDMDGKTENTIKRLFYFDGEDLITFTTEIEWKAARQFAITNNNTLHISCILNNKNKEYTPQMPYPRISQPFSSIKRKYKIVVIGSGYGGSIAAMRLCRMSGIEKGDVCLLERGRELSPGEYPKESTDIFDEMRITLPDGSLYGRENGFIDFIAWPSTFWWRGCGLGGGSLVNSNVSIKPDPRVYESWPPEFTTNPEQLEEGFKRAKQVLNPTAYPFRAKKPLNKLNALEEMAKADGKGTFSLCDLNITWNVTVNPQGLYQPACSLCGDCNTGCNEGAKNTLLMNYLPDAFDHGCQIFVQCEVMWIEKIDDGQSKYKIHCKKTTDGNGKVCEEEEEEEEEFTVDCDMVFLGAGSLGSAEIMVRSKERGLNVSDHVGQRIGADGDFGGFAYNCEKQMSAVGYTQGWSQEPVEGLVGPCISSVWDLRQAVEKLEDGIIIEDLTIPGQFIEIVQAGLLLASFTIGENTDNSIGGRLAQMARIIDSFEKPFSGANANTFCFGGMAHDDQKGNMVINSETRGPVLEWPTAVNPSLDKAATKLMHDGTAVLKGVFVNNPASNPPFPDLISPRGIGVHPLGGCIMGTGAENGVVNHKGQLFVGNSGTDLHEGFYICDASVIPNSVGVNTLFVISAVAERIMMLFGCDQGRKMDLSTKG